MDTTTVLGALKGLFDTCLSLYNSCHTRKRHKEEEQNARKADITARIEEVRFGNRIRYRIRVHNQGRAIARNVQIDQERDNLWNLSGWVNETFPANLQPGEGLHSIRIEPRPYSHLEAKVTLRWEDDFCSNNGKIENLKISQT